MGNDQITEYKKFPIYEFEGPSLTLNDVEGKSIAIFKQLDL